MSAPMRLAFVGDIALGDHPKAVGFGFRSRYPAGIPLGLVDRIRPPGPRPDVLLGNLEFALGFETIGAPDLATMQCRGLTDYAAFLAAAGVTALNVANNHSTQAGPAAFDATVRALRAVGIRVIGTPADFTDDGICEVSGRRIAMLGWSDRPRQYAADVPPYNELSETAYDRIADARRRTDIVIASVHWGDEFILVPGEREREIGRRMVDAGATCVIGHHPHVVREVERYGGGVIAYSLGNFVCDMIWDVRTRLTGWLTVELSDDAITASRLTPGIIDDDYFPRPVAGDRGARLLGRLQRATRSQRSRVDRAGYASVADRERRHHALRTAAMMLRNLHRFPHGMAGDVFRGALGHRVRALLQLQPPSV